MPAKKRAKRKNSKKKPSFLRSFLLKTIVLALLGFVVWLVYLDFTVRAKFNGDKWAIPARVYSQPLELYEGLALSASDLVSELNALGYDRVTRPGHHSKSNGEYLMGVFRL